MGAALTAAMGAAEPRLIAPLIGQRQGAGPEEAQRRRNGREKSDVRLANLPCCRDALYRLRPPPAIGSGRSILRQHHAIACCFGRRHAFEQRAQRVVAHDLALPEIHPVRDLFVSDLDPLAEP